MFVYSTEEETNLHQICKSYELAIIDALRLQHSD